MIQSSWLWCPLFRCLTTRGLMKWIRNFAVQAQQIMGDYLSELSPEDVPEFRRIVSRIADERSSGDPVIADYLRRLADGLASQE